MVLTLRLKKVNTEIYFIHQEAITFHSYLQQIATNWALSNKSTEHYVTLNIASIITEFLSTPD